MLIPFVLCAGIIMPFIPQTGISLPKPILLSQSLNLYLTIGVIVLLANLWRSKSVTNDDKIWWTLVLFIFGFLLAPLYWFMVVNKDTAQQADITATKA